jgi:hypothetical protein
MMSEAGLLLPNGILDIHREFWRTGIFPREKLTLRCVIDEYARWTRAGTRSFRIPKRERRTAGDGGAKMTREVTAICWMTQRMTMRMRRGSLTTNRSSIPMCPAGDIARRTMF